MKDTLTHHGIRPNPSGDYPQIDPSAFVDPSAQIIGNVRIGPNVFIACNAVIKADEPDSEGRIHPVVIEAETNIQDGVIIHSRGGASVNIGKHVSIAHGVVIHGPCTVGDGSLVAIKAVLYNATLEENVWVGLGALVINAAIPSQIVIPAGAVIRSEADVTYCRLANIKEDKYKENVFSSAAALREGYMALCSGIL